MKNEYNYNSQLIGLAFLIGLIFGIYYSIENILPKLNFWALQENANETKRNKLAINLLSRVCDEYLNRWDGDFIKIEMSDEFQR
jgi:hypothetical protein